MLPASVVRALEPRSIAVFGANDRLNSSGGIAWRNLSAHRGGAQIWPVNPKYAWIGETPCLKSTAEIPQTLDLAILALPPQRALAALDGMRTRPPAFVLTAPAEVDFEFDHRTHRKMLGMCRSMGTRWIGPESFGLFLPQRGLCAGFSRMSVQEHDGRVALVAQSGLSAAAAAESLDALGVGLTAVISTGLEADLDLSAFVEYFAKDRDTRVIALELDFIRNPRRLFSTIRNASLLKPVVIRHSGAGAGRSGERLASLLASAPAYDDDAFTAFVEQAGAVRMFRFEDFVGAAAAFAAARPPAGRRTALLSNDLSLACAAAEALRKEGLSLPDLSAESRSAPLKHSGLAAPAVNPVLLKPTSTSEDVAREIDRLLRSPNVDAVMFAYADTPLSPNDPAFRRLAHGSLQSYKPLLVGALGRNVDSDILRQFRSVPGCRAALVGSPATAAAALGALIQDADVRERRREAPLDLDAVLSSESVQAVRRLCADASVHLKIEIADPARTEILNALLGTEWRSEIDQLADLRLTLSCDPGFGPILKLQGAAGKVCMLPPIEAREIDRLALRIAPSGALEAARNLLLSLSEAASRIPELLGITLAHGEEPRLYVRSEPAGRLRAPVIRPAPEQRIPLENGFVMRAIRAADYAQLRSFIENLSERSFYLRFHSAARLSEERISSLVRMDYDRECAWAIEDENGCFAAVARWHVGILEDEAEFGIVVRDDMRRRGFASRLMRRLESDAAIEGFQVIAGYVLPGNDTMDALMQKLDFTLDRREGVHPEHLRRWFKPLRAAKSPTNGDSSL